MINRISDIKNILDELNSRIEMIKVSELEYQSIDIIQYGKYRDTRTQEKKIIYAKKKNLAYNQGKIKLFL